MISDHGLLYIEPGEPASPNPAIDHITRKTCAAFLHEGDVTQNNNAPQWRLAKDTFDVLSEAGVPYAIALGNHDYGFTPQDKGNTLFNHPSYFGPGSAYANQASVGGFFQAAKTDNSYHIFHAGGRDWIVLVLEWQPGLSLIAWADRVLEEHPEHTAILLTHEYLSNESFRTGPGQTLWRELVSKHDFAFVFCGHRFGTGRLTSVGASGQVVHQVLANYQHLTEGGNGYLRLVQIMPDGREVRILTYSPFTDSFMRNAAEQFDLALCDSQAELGSDINRNRIPDRCEPDCDDNGAPDDFDIRGDSGLDANRNGTLDACDVHADFTMTPESGTEPLEILVDSRVSTTREGNVIVGSEWFFRGGIRAVGETVTHTFTEPGPKTIVLTVKDDRERISTIVRRASVFFRSEDVTPWRSEEIGELAFPGGSRLEDGCARVFAGRGTYRSGRPGDEIYFMHRELSGDFSLTARLTTVTGRGRTGLMFRESLDPGAAQATVHLSGSRVAMYYRLAAGTNSLTNPPTRSGTVLDLWLRLERRGSWVVGAVSPDGESWEAFSPVKVDLPATYLAGIASASSGSLQTITSTFCDLELVEVEADSFLRGDCNGDGNVDVTDPVSNLGFQFVGTFDPPCLDALDFNDSGELDITDPIASLTHQFIGGPPPAPPGKDACGGDPTDDELSCESYAVCQGDS